MKLFIATVKKMLEQDEKDVLEDLFGVIALFVALFVVLIPGGPG